MAKKPGMKCKDYMVVGISARYGRGETAVTYARSAVARQLELA